MSSYTMPPPALPITAINVDNTMTSAHLSPSSSSTSSSSTSPSSSSISNTHVPITINTYDPLSIPIFSNNINPSSTPISVPAGPLLWSSNGTSDFELDTTYQNYSSFVNPNDLFLNLNPSSMATTTTTTTMAQTPLTAATVWSQPSAIEPSFFPAPPITASATTSFNTMPFGAPPPTSTATPLTDDTAPTAAYTGLTPLFADFNTATANGGPVDPSFRPSGPIRGYSTGAALPGPRRRSSTLASISPSALTSIHPSHPYSSTRGSTLLFSPEGQGGPSKRIFHPSPAAISSIPIQEGIPSPVEPAKRTEKKPRYKPTKEMSDILVGSYLKNKHPDRVTREALAKQIGEGVQEKTIAVWFQNRRSKSKAKEYDAKFPKPIHTRNGGAFSHGASTASSLSLEERVEAVRVLAHIEDGSVAILPITVMAIGTWSRFAPFGSTQPDLGATISFSPQPTLMLYLTHEVDLFRITIPLNDSSISSLQAVDNPNPNLDTVAIRFRLAGGVASFNRWAGAGWEPVTDFTAWASSRGGDCELTGDKELLLEAFSRIQGLVILQSTWRHPISIPAFPVEAVQAVQVPTLAIPSLGTDGDQVDASLEGAVRGRSYSQPSPISGPSHLVRPSPMPLTSTISYNDGAMSWGTGADVQASFSAMTTPVTGLTTPVTGLTGTPLTGVQWGYSLSGSSTMLPTPITSNAIGNVNANVDNYCSQFAVPGPTCVGGGVGFDSAFGDSNSGDHSRSQSSIVDIGTPPFDLVGTLGMDLDYGSFPWQAGPGSQFVEESYDGVGHGKSENCIIGNNKV